MLAAHRDLGGGAETLLVWKTDEALAWLGLPQDCDPSAVSTVGEVLATA
jgi:hypothetical protein